MNSVLHYFPFLIKWNSVSLDESLTSQNEDNRNEVADVSSSINVATTTAADGPTTKPKSSDEIKDGPSDLFRAIMSMPVPDFSDYLEAETVLERRPMYHRHALGRSPITPISELRQRRPARSSSQERHSGIFDRSNRDVHITFDREHTASGRLPPTLRRLPPPNEAFLLRDEERRFPRPSILGRTPGPHFRLPPLVTTTTDEVSDIRNIRRRLHEINRPTTISTTEATTTTAGATSEQELPTAVEPLLEMGFTRRHINLALQATHGDERMDSLVTWLLENPLSDAGVSGMFIGILVLTA